MLVMIPFLLIFVNILVIIAIDLEIFYRCISLKGSADLGRDSEMRTRMLPVMTQRPKMVPIVKRGRR